MITIFSLEPQYPRKQTKATVLKNNFGIIFMLIILIPSILTSLKLLGTTYFGEKINGKIVHYEIVKEYSSKGGESTYYIPIISVTNSDEVIEIPIYSAKAQKMANHIGDEVSIRYSNDNIVIDNDFYKRSHLSDIMSSIMMLGIIGLTKILFSNSIDKYNLKNRKLISLYLFPAFILGILGLCNSLYFQNKLLTINPPVIAMIFFPTIGISAFIYSIVCLIKEYFKIKSLKK